MANPADAFTDLVLEVFRLNGRLLAAGDRLAAPVGLTSARWQVLGAIDGQPLSVAGIARAMGLTRQSVQRTADLLAAEGSVAFVPNPQHKRAKLVDLTPTGRAMLREVTVLQKAWAERTAAGLPAARIEAAAELLRTLRRRLEQAESDGNETDEGKPRC
jgi:DNA-binding MarR family transcriptional regulator